MGGPLVLMFNLDNPTGSKLRLLCMKLKLRARSVDPGQFGLPVGTLAGLLPPAEPEPVTPFQDEMLLFCNMDGATLNAFLRGIRSAGIPGIALKAVLTPTNASWNAVALHDELVREHEAMQKGQSAHT